MADINLCKLDSRWCGCTSGHSGPSPSWSRTTGSCLRLKSRTCSWTSSRCLATQRCASSMTSSNEHAWLRSVLTRLRIHSHASSVRTCNTTAQSGDGVKFMASCPKTQRLHSSYFHSHHALPSSSAEGGGGVHPKICVMKICWCLIFFNKSAQHVPKLYEHI